jgi:hypothetical protein
MPNRRALRGIRISCVLLASSVVFTALAQIPGSYAPGPGESLPFTQASGGAPALLAPDQLDNVVAPVALYPDQLLSQVLAASTYPLEIVEAQQWLRQNGYLRGPQLVDAAKQQNWDPSVQALVIFPDALALLTRDVQWTTALGNAFLAQQADVMNAVQIMRERAQQNGRLQSNQRETVTQQPVEGGPPVIQIQPANPQVVYVPQYNPEYVWGPPVYGAYPPLWYPSVGFGFGYGAGVFLGGLFAGFLGFGGWGWGLNWLAHGLFLNGLFFHHFGFAGFGGAYGGHSLWAHNPAHRMGVAYPNRAVASRFGSTRYNGAARFSGGNYGASRTFSGKARSYSGTRSYGGESRGFESRGYAGTARSYGGGESRSFAGNARSYAAPRAGGSERGFEGNRQSGRSYSNSFSSHYSAPRSSGRAQSQHFSAPKAPRSSGGGHFSAPHSSGGHGGGGGHGHSGGGSHKH